MQIVLQATHGIVSGSPEFFKRAFGDTYEDFEAILARPHHYIFNREWYERFDGRAEFDDYSADLAKLSQSQRAELMEMLAGYESDEYERLMQGCSDSGIRRVLRYYFPLTRAQERAIWTEARERKGALIAALDMPSEEEKVEDAGLFDSDVPVHGRGEGQETCVAGAT
jgi:hypothetical protein